MRFHYHKPDELLAQLTNEEETKAVRHCANVIKSEFQDWIFKDPDRREDLVKTYNEIYNSIAILTPPQMLAT